MNDECGEAISLQDKRIVKFRKYHPIFTIPHSLFNIHHSLFVILLLPAASIYRILYAVPNLVGRYQEGFFDDVVGNGILHCIKIKT